MKNPELKSISLCDFEAFRIGNAQNATAGTGCTVVICEAGAVAGVDVRGGSPGTRETDALNPCNIRQSIHAVLLSGGSAFGLDAAGGVMSFLEEKGVGRDVEVAKVPIVCGAILFDLKCGDAKVRPDARMGYEACLGAYHNNFQEGNFGAGTGATIGKSKGREFAMKGGVGTACFQVGNLKVGAVIAVNCVGDVYDSSQNRLIAGVLNDDKRSIEGTERLLLKHYADTTDFFSGNTVIGVIITNAAMTKAQANKLASVAQNGIARAVRPAHSIFDGDTIFTMASGNVAASPDAVGILSAHAVEDAIVSAIKHAKPAYGYRAYRELWP